MKKIIIITLCLFPVLAFAGVLVLPQSNISPNPAYSRNLSLGTKGMANYSTSMRDAVRFKAATAAGVATTVKVFLDGDETKVYPASEDTYSFERGKVTKIGFRAYSTAVPVTVHVWSM